MSASGSANAGAVCPGCSMLRRFYAKSFFICQVLARACREIATETAPPIIAAMKLLGGLTPHAFLRGYWQKRPLLVRGALPQLADLRGELSDLRTLFALAARDDVESRMVERRGRRWETAHGPFPRFHLRKSDATLLVGGINLHLAAADALLRRFAFIPQARLDDVMVSYASPGGGVGPHVDSYDVFLLQGPGRRRWRIRFQQRA